jgi:hypothetical protein
VSAPAEDAGVVEETEGLEVFEVVEVADVYEAIGKDSSVG